MSDIVARLTNLIEVSENECEREFYTELRTEIERLRAEHDEYRREYRYCDVDLDMHAEAMVAAERERSDFQTLRAAAIQRDIEYPGSNAIDSAFRGVELAGEVGEACNVIKKLERERRGIAGKRATIDDLAAELADVIICVDLVAMDYGIDLWPAVVRKFNASSDALSLKTRIEGDANIALAAERAARIAVASPVREEGEL